MTPILSSETIHASAVAIDGRAVLLWGRSGAGKSDLALRLIDRGAQLISDDYTLLKRSGDGLVASAPANIAGRMEVRGIGILPFDTVADVPVGLLAVLDEPVERMPEEGLSRRFAGRDVPAITLGALEPSAPIKVELALKKLGLRG